MSLLDIIIGIVAPHSCLMCAAEGAVMCDRCFKNLQPVLSRCYRCRKLTQDYRTCSSCRSSSHLYSVKVSAVYASTAKILIWRLKYGGTKAATSNIAKYLSRKHELPVGCVLVPVPTATSRVRQRGYDQAKLLARNLSQTTGHRYMELLARSGHSHQIGAGRQQRLKQLSTAYRLKSLTSANDLHIMLVDDVVTTGATLEAAARCLKFAGAKRIEAIVFAQP